MKKLVFVKGEFGNYYLDTNLKFQESETECCVWEDLTKDEIMNIIKEDMNKHGYEVIAIEDVKEEEE